MKKGKRLTLRQKRALSESDIENADRYMVCVEKDGVMVLRDKRTGKTRMVEIKEK